MISYGGKFEGSSSPSFYHPDTLVILHTVQISTQDHFDTNKSLKQQILLILYHQGCAFHPYHIFNKSRFDE